MIGEIVNYRYEVLEKIGEGDVFAVYKVRDKVLNRLAALKVLQKDCADNPDFVRAVRAGYNSVAAMDHPYIARVLDSDPASEDNFIACEYCRGTNVKDRIKRAGAIQVPTALDIIIPVLEALEYAHANRNIHGDLRPRDIIVSPDGEIKVTDFGLSSALQACPEVADRLSMRSVQYEAPEMAEGAEPSVGSDLYSVGVILYEMITGSLPFDGPTAISIALKQAKDIPAAPRNLNTAVPKSLSDVVMRAIAKPPAERFPNASAMLEDLRAIRDALKVGKPVSVPQPSTMVPGPAVVEESRGESVVSASSIIWLMLVFVMVVLLVGGLTIHLNMRSAKVEVPYVLGMTVDEAREAARQKDFTLEEDSRGGLYSNDYEEGKIAQQTPDAHARVEHDKAVVKYRLSMGPNSKPVPDLTGLPGDEAEKAAEEAGFTIGKRTSEYDDRIPEGAVIRQDPEKETTALPKSSISLVISKGPKPEAPPVDQNTTAPQGAARNFQIAINVPKDAKGQQEVRVVLDDSQGETTPVLEYYDPGDKFDQTVTGYGDRVRIRVYVGGKMVYDKQY